MRLKDMNVYQLSTLLFSLEDLFEKDPIMINCNANLNKKTTKEVFNPEMSLSGLQDRQKNITIVAIALMIISVVFCLFVSVPILLIFQFNALTIWLPFIFFSIISSAIYIAAFRAGRASLDEIKFKKQGQPKDFKLNERVYIRWYDFLAGVPIGLLSLTWW